MTNRRSLLRTLGLGSVVVAAPATALAAYAYTRQKMEPLKVSRWKDGILITGDDWSALIERVNALAARDDR